MNVEEMQRKLSRRAEQEPEHRFGDLYSLLYHPDWLRMAHDSVRRNAGSQTAGYDGLTMKEFEQDLEGNLQTLRDLLKAKTFEPSPARRTRIRERKPSGQVKIRPLGILVIQDRIVQEALRMILEPIFEADFSRHSYGFRPNRCTMDAVTYLVKRLVPTGAYGWIIEGDITSYFDRISHKKLRSLLRRRIRDVHLERLVWSFLRAGVMDQGSFRHTLLGTPQGGIVSPLLSNVYLHELDKYMEQYTEVKNRWYRKQKGIANFLYVRYADDFVILCDGTKAQALAMRQEIHDFLRDELMLELSLDKTKVTHVQEGFDFLGFRIERSIGRRGVLIPKLKIPDEALRKYRAKVDTTLALNTTNDSLRAKILAVNRITGGWCRYYQYVTGPSMYFKKAHHHTYWLMARWLAKKYKLRLPDVMRKFKQGSTFRTATLRMVPAQEYKAKRYPPRVLRNPYTSQEEPIREELPVWEEWTGSERRKGEMDLKEEIYLRDQGMCGQCGMFVPWDAAHLDHIKPRKGFKHAKEADRWKNLQILHAEPCHREKTIQDLQVLSRMKGKLSCAALNGECGETGQVRHRAPH